MLSLNLTHLLQLQILTEFDLWINHVVANDGRRCAVAHITISGEIQHVDGWTDTVCTLFTEL